MKSLLFASILTVLTGIMMVGGMVAAEDLFKPAVCSSAPNSAVCQDAKQTGNPVSGPNGIINKAAGLVAIVSGIASVIMIIIAGIKFITANGDSNAVASARNTIIYAGIGLVVTAIAGSIVLYLSDKLFV